MNVPVPSVALASFDDADCASDSMPCQLTFASASACDRQGSAFKELSLLPIEPMTASTVTPPFVLTPAAVGGSAGSYAAQQIGVPCKNSEVSPTLDLYLVATVGGTITFGSITDLVFFMNVAQD
jgi:hypothetical protein